MSPKLSNKTLLAGSILLAGAAVCASLAMRPAADPLPVESRSATLTERAKPQDSEADALLDELRSLTEGGSVPDFQALQQTLQSLVRKNPQAAADFAGSLSEGSIREIALHRVAQAWATRHPEAAAKWANAIRNQEERGTLLNGIFCEVAQSDPAKAIQMAETYDMLSFSPGMSGNLIQQWATRDYDAALRWTTAQPASSPRDEMVARLALVRCTTSPEEAARMISEQIPAGSVQEEAAIAVVSRWAATDPEGAKAWASSFDVAAFRERAMKEILLGPNRSGKSRD